MMLSRRIIEPAKLALAIVIIYAISFYMGWEKPYWATVSAISVNLLSTGLTLHRGLIRTLGTAIGGFMGMAVIGMFPQERWAYLCAISVVLFVFSYMATGKKEPYFYLIVLITFMVVMAVVQGVEYSDSATAFEVVMLRVTQTLMGSFVMIMIMVYIFPYRTVDEFENLARIRWSIQRRLYSAYRGMLFGEEEAEDTKALRMEDAPLLELAHFKLHGAQEDTFEMLEVGHDWHHYLDLTAAQYEALESLRQSLYGVQDLDLTNYLPNLDAVRAELDQRFEQTEQMLAKKEPTEFAHHLTVSLDENQTRELPHFQEAAVRVIRTQLGKLEEVSLSLFNCVARIRSFERPSGTHDDHHGHGAGGHGFALDGFRLTASIAFVASVWVAFFLWLYVYDMPRGSLYPCFVVITASILMYRPEANHVAYAGAWLVGAIAAAFCYLFIMQHLSGYLQFSVMVFIGIFLLQYILYPHVHPMVRIFVSIGFVIVIDAENHMHYDLQHYLQTVLWMATVLGTTLFVRFAFISRRPDVNFMKVLDQFFRHADFLLSAHDAEGRPDRSLGRRLRSVFYRYSLLEDAHRLALFAGQVDIKSGQLTYKMLRETPPEQVQELVRSVFALGHRVEALVDAREASQSYLVDKHLMDEKREWTEVMLEWFRHRPGEAQTAGPDGDLTERLASLEKHIDEAYARIDEGELSTEDYRGLRELLPAAGSLPGPLGGGGRLCPDCQHFRLATVAGDAILKTGSG
jgi:uncharacterized membrane protein YccC